MKSAIRKDNWHELQVYVVNGQLKPFSARLAMQLYTFRPFWIATGFMAAFIAIVGSDFLLGTNNALFQIAFWLFAAYVVLGLWIIQGAILGWIALRRQKVITTYTVVLHIIPVACAAELGHLLAYFLEPASVIGPILTPIEYLRTYVLAVVFELLILQWIEPIWTRHREASFTPPDDPLTMPLSLNVSGNEIPTANLSHLQAAEHYVEIFQLDGTSQLYRTNLKDLVANFTHADGVQPHRSFWVFRHSISGLGRQGTYRFLILQNGTEVPIARTRLVAVQQWLETYMPTNGGKTEDATIIQLSAAHKKRPSA